jgi:hypothetical protein
MPFIFRPCLITLGLGLYALSSCHAPLSRSIPQSSATPIPSDTVNSTLQNIWNSKLLITKVNSKTNKIQSYSQQSDYRDENQNGIQDPSDAGFFNPASTVKIAIAALALEQLQQQGFDRMAEYRTVGGSWYTFADDIARSVVISDNDSTNRLMLWLGFDRIHQHLQAKGLNQIAINRLMLDRGTLTPSPAFEMRANGKVTTQPAQAVTIKPSCYETEQRIGNCATAADLIGVLRRIVQPQAFTESEQFQLRDRDWLQTILSQTPRQAGFDYADDYCRFLTPLQQQLKPTRLLSKCGVALFSNTYVDTSVIETADQIYFIVLAVTPPRSIPERQIFNTMNEIVSSSLSRLP